MAHKLYALLVGIDKYPAPSKPLRGCVNDVQAMEAFLKGRIKRERLELVSLCDQDATRDSIFRAFRHHLGRAGLGDTALFFFGGHGSQEHVPPLYASAEPDQLSETLVAYDSRQPGGWDLADKELAVLIAEIAVRGPHVVIVLDSCHAGTATRVGGGAERRAARLRKSRPAETYWFFEQQNEVPPVLNEAGGWRVLPTGSHVLLASCRDFETACERVMPDDKRHGLFSYHLVETLQCMGSEATYRELHLRVQTRVNNLNPNQLPQAEGEIDRRLFDGAVLPRPRTYTVRWRRSLGWRLDAGAIHGIQQGSELAVLSAKSQDKSERLATFRVSRVAAAESPIELVSGHLSRSCDVWPAVLTDIPLAPLRVALEGDSALVGELAQLLTTSPFLATVDGPAAAEVVVHAVAGSYRLRRPHTASELVASVNGGVSAALQALEHIARWQTAAKLENLGSPLDGAIEMTVHTWHGLPGADGQPQVEPASEDGGEIRMAYTDGRPPRFAVRLWNHTEQPLFFALFGLDEACAVKILRGGRGRLAPGHTIWIRPDGIAASVPDDLHENGVTQRRDVLLLLVSEADADFFVLEQGSLGLPYRQRRATPTTSSLGVLEALMERVGHREIDEEPAALVHHWSAERRVIIAERPLPVTQLEREVRSHLLPAGIHLRTPGGFEGSVKLYNAVAAGRRLGRNLVPPPLSRHDAPLHLIALAGELGSDGGICALEIVGAESALVTPAAPLRVEAHIQPGEDDALLAVAYDGRRHFLVGGSEDGVSEESVPAVWRIDCLPESISSSVWLLFYSLPRREYEGDALSALLGQELPRDPGASTLSG